MASTGMHTARAAPEADKPQPNPFPQRIDNHHMHVRYAQIERTATKFYVGTPRVGVSVLT